MVDFHSSKKSKGQRKTHRLPDAKSKKSSQKNKGATARKKLLPNPDGSSKHKDKDALAKAIFQLLSEQSYQPLERREIARALNASGGAVKKVYTILDELERTGKLARVRKSRYIIPRQANLLSGIIQMHSKGFGHLLSSEPGQPDLFIAPANTGTAMHGDRVLVREVPKALRKRRFRDDDDRSEGEVVRILERANQTIVGTLEQTSKFYYVIPDDPRLPQNIYIQQLDEKNAMPAQVDDKVVVRMREWQSRHVNPEGEIVEKLGKAGAPGVDILSILRKYDLPTEFPQPVHTAADNIADRVSKADLHDRDDWRERFVFTIDPSDARDFDDAIHVEKLATGWRLAVHIADVSHYVTPGSELDKEARRRGNSVYLPDRVIPMLPEKLSNGICSLVPDAERLTRLALIDLDSTGKITKATFARAVIRSAKRLTYEEAMQLLAAPANDHLGKLLQTAWELASLLRKNRFAKGSLELDFPEVKVEVDQSGTPVAIHKLDNDISHQLIEEFMLVANEAVARELLHRKLPAIYRVHEDPDPVRLQDYAEFIQSHGLRTGDLTQRASIQRLLNDIKGTHEEYALKLGLLKSLQKARYDASPLGHYGLYKSNYCHFTSPIRRYADLVVHRAMLPLLDNPPPKSKSRILPAATSMQETADYISATERNAQEAERDATKLKKLEFFALQLDQRKPTHFPAIVTEIRPHGMFVELPDYMQTGFIRVSSLRNDFFVYDAGHQKLIGRRTRKSYQIGDQLKVLVEAVNMFKQHVDFRPAKK